MRADSCRPAEPIGPESSPLPVSCRRADPGRAEGAMRKERKSKTGEQRSTEGTEGIKERKTKLDGLFELGTRTYFELWKRS